MTERLYYADSFLYEFEAKVSEVVRSGDRTALVLDRTTFYPVSGGQLSDTGWIETNGTNLRIVEVAEDESGSIVHYLDGGIEVELKSGTQVRGSIDVERRQDHMRQHSGQHVISAAFERLFSLPTVSFHMGDESCTIDLAATSLSDEQVRQAERDANRVVMEDRPVEVRSATVEQARNMGVRKIPDHVEGELRLIEIRDYDLNACGGTHVRSTGQIGPILLRHFEKVKQGFRVEFVCGERAITTARRDFETLTSAASAYAAHIWTVPDLVRKSLDEVKTAAKERKKLLEEIAELLAGHMIAEAAAANTEAPTRNSASQILARNSEQSDSAGSSMTRSPDGPMARFLIVRFFPDRDISFIKLLAQKITALAPSVVLLGAGLGQPGVVFAQSPGLPHDMGALMKEALVTLGGRGGGSRDLAQGGAADASKIAPVLDAIRAKIASTN